MNVQGAFVEQRLGRAIMSRFHAGFSLGTVGRRARRRRDGRARRAGLGAPRLVGAVVAVGVPLAARRFSRRPRGRRSGTRRLPASALGGAPDAARRRVRPRLRVRRGSGNDWISVARDRRLRRARALGTLALAAFLTAMTGRRVGSGRRLLDRYGRVPVVRAVAAGRGRAAAASSRRSSCSRGGRCRRRARRSGGRCAQALADHAHLAVPGRVCGSASIRARPSRLRAGRRRRAGARPAGADYLVGPGSTGGPLAVRLRRRCRCTASRRRPGRPEVCAANRSRLMDPRPSASA